jgi:superfamily II DNA or RNA helicase
MADVKIQKKNEVHIKLICEPHILYEMQEYFTFDVPGSKFMPQYRNKYWDGKIRLLSVHTGEIYVGLLDKVIEKLKRHDYTYEFINNKYYGLPFELNESISEEGLKDYMNLICVGEKKPRDYQIRSVFDCLKYNRRLMVSPTSSGKSLMMYSIVRYFTELNKKSLIIVPTTSLVEQLVKEFNCYGWDADANCHKIYTGKEKITKSSVVVSTWQSIYQLDRVWFEDFDVVVGDECHIFKSKSLVSIMSKLHHAKYRFGFTGTLDGTQTHKWVLEGLFGPSYKVIQTNELIEKGYISDLNIKCIVLKHPPQKFENFEDEVQFIINHTKRNKFIQKLTLSLTGNTLVLFSRVETHGLPLYNLINSKRHDNQKVFFVHGGVSTEDREKIREITEREKNAIIVASYGVFSTGINIQNLHNVVFASPSKSRIRNLQSIGRALRKSSTKDKAMLYDISDDCRKNYTLNHFIERIKIYNEEKFNYEITTVNMEDK